jgi:tight adherence protein C
MVDVIMDFLLSLTPNSMLPLAAGMLVAGLTIVAFYVFSDRTERQGVRKRLVVMDVSNPSDVAPDTRKKRESELKEKTLKKAAEFYTKSDPDAVARIRMQLIQAGFMQPEAPAIYFAARFILLAVLGILSLVITTVFFSDVSGMKFWSIMFGFAAAGYVTPTLALSWMTREKQREYRNGFPDFLDLMIVCADSGMSMEAAIERVSREIQETYPSLSQNLQLLVIELRAGRNTDDAMKSLAERIGLDEVRSFATLLQQSRELGTSLSGALRVFSDEMRHKRMSLAEEKAHALPAKMSVPVTMCILPVVLLIAVIPIIAKLSAGD